MFQVTWMQDDEGHLIDSFSASPEITEHDLELWKNPEYQLSIGQKLFISFLFAL